MLLVCLMHLGNLLLLIRLAISSSSKISEHFYLFYLFNATICVIQLLNSVLLPPVFLYYPIMFPIFQIGLITLALAKLDVNERTFCPSQAILKLFLVLSCIVSGMYICIGAYLGTGYLKQYATYASCEITAGLYIVLPGTSLAIGSNINLISPNGLINVNAKLVTHKQNRGNKVLTVVHGLKGNYGAHKLYQLNVASQFTQSRYGQFIDFFSLNPVKFLLSQKLHLQIDDATIALASNNDKNSFLSLLPTDTSLPFLQKFSTSFAEFKFSMKDLRMLNEKGFLYFACTDCILEAKLQEGERYVKFNFDNNIIYGNDVYQIINEFIMGKTVVYKN